MTMKVKFLVFLKPQRYKWSFLYCALLMGASITSENSDDLVFAAFKLKP